MVDGQVRTTDVTDVNLLDAMLAVPRELFVAEGKRELAYIDEDLEIAPARSGSPARFLMEPSPFAKLVQLASIGARDAVLEVGCGSGYGAAVLSRLARSVVALDCEPALTAQAQAALSQLGVGNVSVVTGDHAAGHAAGAPFDAILLGGAIETVPETLFSQLAEGGRLVVVEGRGNAGIARLYLKSGEVVAGRRGFNAAVKPLPGFDRVPEFEF